MTTDERGIERAEQWLAELFAPWVLRMGLRVRSVGPGEATLVLPFSAELCRSGGTLCGQALMAGADTAMAIAIAMIDGEFRPTTTVSQNCSFMRPVANEEAVFAARVLKPGRTLVFGEIDISAAGKRCAHATATYAML